MANVWTPFINTAYAAFYTYLRNQKGLVSSVRLDGSAESLAVGQTITFPIVPSTSAVDATPAMTPSEGSSITVSNNTAALQYDKKVPLVFTGEDVKALSRSISHQQVLLAQFENAFHTLSDAIEATIAAEYVNACRGFGNVSGGAFLNPTDMIDDTAELIKLFEDNGSPINNLRAVVNTSVARSLRKQDELTRVDASGNDLTLRRGVIQDLNGIPFSVSSAIKRTTKGTGSSGTTDATGYAVGSTTITLASAGTGTIVAGDAIKFDGDDEFYIVKTGDTNISNGGTIVLQEPGLRTAIAASATNITIQPTAARNMVFDRNAIILLTRTPAIPPGGDLGEHVVMTDPFTGLSFDVATYRGYREVSVEIGIVWGVKTTNPHNLMLYLTK